MPEPIISRLPDTTKALQNKYGKNPALVDPTSPIANALQLLDVQRVKRGQQPMSVRQHAQAMISAQQNTQFTKEPDKGIFNDFVRNVRELTSSIPRLPVAMFKEAQALPTLPMELSKAMGTDGSFVDKLAAVAHTPGIRMLPGAYIAGNLNNTGELWDNPLFTALDIIPGKEAPIYKSAKGAVKDSAAVAKLSSATEPLRDAIRSSKPGQLISETFGTQARDLSEMAARGSRKVNDAMHNVKGTGDATWRPIEALSQRAAQLTEKFPTLDTNRRTELTRLMQEDADSIAKLPAHEQAFINEVRDITDQLGHYGVNEGLLGVVDGEFYTAKDAGKIITARRKRDISQEFQSARHAAVEGGEVPALQDSMRAILNRDDLKPGAKTKLIEGYAHGLESAGMDATLLFREIREANKTKSLGNLERAINLYDGMPLESRTMDELIEAVKPHAKTDPMAARMLDHMKAKRWKEARTIAKRIGTRKKFPIPGMEEVVERASILSSRDRFLRTTRKFNDKRVSTLTNIADKVERRTPAARFIPKLQDTIDRTIADEVTTRLSTDPDLPAITTALREKNYGWLRKNGFIDEAEFQRINDEIMSTWRELKDSGYNPVFVHHMSEQSINTLKHPRVLEHLPTPTSARARTNDFTPYLDDVSIALPKQAMDYLVRKGSEEFITETVNTWGRTADDVLQDYIPAARQIARRDGDVVATAQRLMQREWQAYSPESIINFGPAHLTQWVQDNNILLPKTVANNIQRMHTPPGGRIATVLDPIMNVFRTSLLPLSPRWHMYNILGGGIVTLARTDPRVFKHMKTAWNMSGGMDRVRGRKWSYSDDLPENIPRGSQAMPQELQGWVSRMGTKERLSHTFNYAGGKTLRRLWDEAQLQKVKDKAGRFIERSYDINGLFDDMYRSASYLYGQDRALTKGMSKEAAERAGVELARKTLQNIDRMTPIERTIIRNVFPFYGWMQHIIRYSLKYPIDHPFRTAAMGAFARNELDDMGDALPYRFLNTFFLGDMDENGNQTGFNLAGMNPFRDVADYFTISGFMGQTNPIISTLLQSVGVDPMSGGPELFPTLRYDPEVGRLAAQPTNPIMNFVNAIVPQSRVLDGMFRSSSEFQALLRVNPDAAGRMLVSQMGLPVLLRNVNIPQEIAKAEIARDESKSLALNQGMKTGNLDEAANYPDLKDIVAKLKELQSTGALDQYQLDNPNMSPAQNAISQAQRSLITNFTGR